MKTLLKNKVTPYTRNSKWAGYFALNRRRNALFFSLWITRYILRCFSRGFTLVAEETSQTLGEPLTAICGWNSASDVAGPKMKSARWHWTWRDRVKRHAQCLIAEFMFRSNIVPTLSSAGPVCRAEGSAVWGLCGKNGHAGSLWECTKRYESQRANQMGETSTE